MIISFLLAADDAGSLADYLGRFGAFAPAAAVMIWVILNYRADNKEIREENAQLRLELKEANERRFEDLRTSSEFVQSQVIPALAQVTSLVGELTPLVRELITAAASMAELRRLMEADSRGRRD